MTSGPSLVLTDAVRRLTARLAALAAALDQVADEPAQRAAWREYATTAEALARLWALVAPTAAPGLVTTKELAQRLGVSPRTVRRHCRSGQLRPALELGKRTIRWTTPAGSPR